MTTFDVINLCFALLIAGLLYVRVYPPGFTSSPASDWTSLMTTVIAGIMGLYFFAIGIAVSLNSFINLIAKLM